VAERTLKDGNETIDLETTLHYIGIFENVHSSQPDFQSGNEDLLRARGWQGFTCVSRVGPLRSFSRTRMPRPAKKSLSGWWRWC